MSRYMDDELSAATRRQAMLTEPMSREPTPLSALERIAQWAFAGTEPFIPDDEAYDGPVPVTAFQRELPS